MKRDYCEEHDDLAKTDEFTEGQVCHYWSHQVSLEHEYGPYPATEPALQHCRMVPMRLIPDNGEIRERVADALDKNSLANGPRAYWLSLADAALAVFDGETP